MLDVQGGLQSFHYFQSAPGVLRSDHDLKHHIVRVLHDAPDLMVGVEDLGRERAQLALNLSCLQGVIDFNSHLGNFIGQLENQVVQHVTKVLAMRGMASLHSGRVLSGILNEA